MLNKLSNTELSHLITVVVLYLDRGNAKKRSQSPMKVDPMTLHAPTLTAESQGH